MRLEIVSFADEHVAAAAVLLAERHRRQRQREALLDARFERAADAGAQIEDLLNRPGSSGAAALRAGAVVGFLLGAPRADAIWGANVWVEPAGHAAAEAEVVRDLYAAAAARWVDEGQTRHFAVVPADDTALLDAWFRLGFGQQHALALAPVPADASAPAGVRPVAARDFETLVRLAPLIETHQAAAPVFSGLPVSFEPDEVREEISGLLAEPGRATFVVESDRDVVGALYLASCDGSQTHAGLARAERAMLLAWAAVVPEARGTGAGVALTEMAFARAREEGCAALAVDWRVPNLLASRFWPRRGFRTTFLRLHRSIP